MPVPAFIVAGFWGSIASFVVSMVWPVVKAIVVALGFGLVTYTGVDLALDQAQGYITTTYSGLPADLLQILYILKLDEGISILFGAMASAISIRTFGQAFKTVSVWKKPGAAFRAPGA